MQQVKSSEVVLSVPAILTVVEVMYCWCKSQTAVLYHIEEDHLSYRQTLGGPYLISRKSVERLWGKPVRGLPDKL